MSVVVTYCISPVCLYVGLSRLTNIKKGDFYGPSSTWPVRKRRQMGVFLLKKGCQIFLVEGERQIRPADIALGQ